MSEGQYIRLVRNEVVKNKFFERLLLVLQFVGYIYLDLNFFEKINFADFLRRWTKLKITLI